MNLIDYCELLEINDEVDLLDLINKVMKSDDEALRAFCKATMRTVNDMKQIKKIIK